MEWLYVGFIAFILALLVLDLGVFHRQAHVVKMREALTWSAVWISLGVAFSGFIYLGYEHHWLGLGTTVDTMATPVVGATASRSTTTAAARW
jgi:tellurite resistance protein TerC